MSHYLLGIDLGSSSVKASIVDANTGKEVAHASSPDTEMEISSPVPGWAEQHPDSWWKHAVLAVRQSLTKGSIHAADVLAIGIAYQMHGLVIVDKQQQVLRPSIIWCDSRAVVIGDQAFENLGATYCLDHFLNSPGNFTASKLKWVKDHEPEKFSRIHKAMLPGDYLAMRLTGEIVTTRSGLSEGILWDFHAKAVASKLLDEYGIDPSILSPVVPTFAPQGSLLQSAASELGLKPGIPVSYRAGDQPNNAFSLNALHPGEVAATAGTSGVIYGIVDKPLADTYSRVNTFVHVNDSAEAERNGVLLCVNGTGIMNSWLKKLLSWAGTPPDYRQLNALASQAPVGADNLVILPFGNGAERMLKNKNIGGSIHGLDLNRHSVSHVSRAIQEGIVFALGYGFEIMNGLGIQSTVIRAGHANMFLSELFCTAFVNVTGAALELYNTDGAQGAARGAGVGIGYYHSPDEAFTHVNCIRHYEPDETLRKQYAGHYQSWKTLLNRQLHFIDTQS
jgi:xylulokinase